MKIRATLVMAVTLVSCARELQTEPVSARAETLQSDPSARHLLVTLEQSASGLALLDVVVVPGPLRQSRMQQPLPWRAVLRDASGQVTWEQEIPKGNQWRSETVGDDGALHSEPAPQGRKATFRVRVPFADGSLELFDRGVSLGSVAIARPQAPSR